MNWNERGVLSSSRIYFFQPINAISQGSYHMTCMGNFQCNEEYCVHRKDTHAPIFVLMLEGALSLTIGNKTGIARANQIVLMDCQSEHNYEAVGHCSFSFFHFSGANAVSLIQRLTEANGGPVFDCDDPEWFELQMSLLSIRLVNLDDVDEFELSGFVYSILCKLQTLVSPAPNTPRITARLIVQAQNYIRTHLTRNITREELAGALNISCDYLAHLFKQDVGCSPIEYHARQRIEYAKSVLLYSTASIAEIADVLGFSSSAAFINAFKLRCGVSPLKYRNSHQGPKKHG